MHSQPLPTVGEIARRLDVPLHRVEYVIRSRQIHPISVAGNARVFSDVQVARIARELRRSTQVHIEPPHSQPELAQTAQSEQEVPHA